MTRRLVNGGAKNPGEAEAAGLLARAEFPPEADDLSQERVWREVAKTLPGRRAPRWRWVLAAGMVTAAFAIGVFGAMRLFARGPSARLELTAGNVLAAAPEGNWMPVGAGEPLAASSRVRTDAKSRAVLVASRAAILVSPSSDLALESLGKDTFLRLSGGEVVSQVDHRAEGESYVVQTTKYRITVRGTVFAVRERGPDDVEVSVSRGLVDVTGEGGTWQVAAGHAWRSRAPQTQGADDIPNRDRSLLAPAAQDAQRSAIRVDGPTGIEVYEGGEELGAAPVTWDAPVGHYHFVGKVGQMRAEGDAATRAGVSANVYLSAQPERAVVAQPEPVAPPAAPAPAPVAVPVRRHISKPLAMLRPKAHAPAPVPPPEPEPAPEPATPPIPEVAPPTPPIPQPSISRPAPEPEDPYASAVALARSGRYREAADAYERVAAAGGPRASLALADLGQVALRKLGDPDRALRAFLRYERAYPNGELLPEVQLSAIEIDLKKQAWGDALGEMNRFLERFPDSERAPEVHLLRGNVYRVRGNCTAALAEYAQARTEALQDDALFYSAVCQQRLGHREESIQTQRDYSTRFPAGKHAAEVRTVLGK